MNALVLRPPASLRPYLLAVGFLVLGLWAFSQAYISGESRVCLPLYRGATTAADTARVDGTVPSLGSGTREAHSCGFIRHTARWF
jgi:hypothetical protein